MPKDSPMLKLGAHLEQYRKPYQGGLYSKITRVFTSSTVKSLATISSDLYNSEIGTSDTLLVKDFDTKRHTPPPHASLSLRIIVILPVGSSKELGVLLLSQVSLNALIS